MKTFTIIIINFLFIFKAFTCDYFEAYEQDNIQTLMGKKSKIYDAYKQGKCVLENALKPLTDEQRRVIANLIAKSYSTVE